MTGAHMFSFKKFKINRITKKLRAMRANRVNNQPTDEQLKKEISYYLVLADIYKKLRCNKSFPYSDVMYIECYKAAAELDDTEAHYQLGHDLLEEAKFRQNLQIGDLFHSPSNHARSKQLYEEAHAHLIAAERLGHIEAKRLHGLCLINGWGLPIDKNAGFELVVASIDQEGSWERVPQIFAAIGLNKPEFFAAIMQRRKDVS